MFWQILEQVSPYWMGARCPAGMGSRGESCHLLSHFHPPLGFPLNKVLRACCHWQTKRWGVAEYYPKIPQSTHPQRVINKGDFFNQYSFHHQLSKSPFSLPHFSVMLSSVFFMNLPCQKGILLGCWSVTLQRSCVCIRTSRLCYTTLQRVEVSGI